MTRRISAIIPAYNAAAYVGEAIRSVRAQVPARAVEIVVIDDGSTDGTAEALAGEAGPDLIFRRQANAGSAAARNAGVALASGDWLAFLDADDLWTADRLALQVAALDAEPGLEAVWGRVAEFRDAPDPAAQGAAAEHPGAVLISRAAFERAGGFPEAETYAEVVDWVSQLRAAGLRDRRLDRVVMHRRLHDANKGLRPDAKAAYLGALKRHLDRKRGGAG